jgi:hypothetical protein
MNKQDYKNLQDKIRSEYESAKRLAHDIWILSDNEGDDNEKWFFELGFISGLNFNSDGTLRNQKFAGLRNGKIVEFSNDRLSLNHDHIDQIIEIKLNKNDN